MQVEFCCPGKEMSFLVKNYETIYSQLPIEVKDKFIPRSDVSIVFNLNGKVKCIDGDTCYVLPKYYITPVQFKHSELEINGPINSFIVVCKVSVLYRLLNIDLSAHNNMPYIGIKDPKFETLWKKLSAVEGMANQISIFESYFSSYFLHKPYKPDTIDNFYDSITENAVSSPLTILMADNSMKNRSLRRHFSKRIGASPKYIARLVRAHFLWRKIESSKVVDFQDIVFEYGYFDQSHLIKDFKSIFGEAPLYFLKRNREQVKLVTGIDF